MQLLIKFTVTSEGDNNVNLVLLVLTETFITLGTECL